MDNIERKLKIQLLVSTILMTLLVIPVTAVLPEKANIYFAGELYECNRWEAFGCVASGLWSGLLIGLITEYYTSNNYAPV